MSLVQASRYRQPQDTPAVVVQAGVGEDPFILPKQSAGQPSCHSTNLLPAPITPGASTSCSSFASVGTIIQRIDNK
jgi:hypothetical protein